MCVCVSVDYHLYSIILESQISLFKMEISLGTRKNGCILLYTLFTIRIYMRQVISEYECFDVNITTRYGIVGLDQLRHNSKVDVLPWHFALIQ